MAKAVENVGNVNPPFGGSGTPKGVSGTSDGAFGLPGQSAGGIKPITHVTIPRGSGAVKDVGDVSKSNICKK